MKFILIGSRAALSSQLSVDLPLLKPAGLGE